MDVERSRVEAQALAEQVWTMQRALWVDQRRALRVGRDTLAALAAAQTPWSLASERAWSSLLEQASREGSRARGDAVWQPFFRLAPEERLVLASLYHLRWSYERLGRLLGIEPEQVATLAWGSRLHVALQLRGEQRLTLGVPRPGPGCPEYHPGRPWPQRWLDEQMGNAERAFIQTHLAHCGSCAQALKQVRQIYFQVRGQVPGQIERESDGVGELANSLAPPPSERRAQDLSGVQSIARFFGRSETQWWLVAAALAIWALEAMRRSAVG